MEPIVTAHFVETMYAHYGEQLLRTDITTLHRKFLEECQQCYIEMHEMIVSFSSLTKNLFTNQ